MKVELIKTPTEITDSSLKQYLADVASVVRNQQPKDNERLFARLLKESYGDKPSRVFEFVPCTIFYGDVPDMYQHSTEQEPHQYFGWFYRENYYTTARELLNWGWSWKEVIEVVDFTHYRAVKCTAPYFIYGQVSTHTQITSVSHSNRYTESGLGYWMPEEAKKSQTQKEWNDEIPLTSQQALQRYMKDTLGIKRREVYARGSNMLEYRVFTLGGYINNPNAWEHFIHQRLDDLHTQLETRQLTQLIKGVIYDKSITTSSK